MKKYAAKANKSITGLSAKAHEQLASYSWPGNVRELANIIERAVILYDAGLLQPQHLNLSHTSMIGENEVWDLEEIEQMRKRPTDYPDPLVASPLAAKEIHIFIPIEWLTPPNRPER